MVLITGRFVARLSCVGRSLGERKISMEDVPMHFSVTKYIKDREIHEENIRCIWKFFSSMMQEQICGETGGTVGVTFKSDAYGKISGDSDDVIDEAMSRRKSINEVIFRFRSKDFLSSMTLSLRDEFSGLFEVGPGGVFELEGSDRRWFDATIKRFEDIEGTLHSTPLCSRLLCRLRWLISASISLGLSFILIRVLNGATHWCGASGGECLEWAKRILFSISVVLFFDLSNAFIRKNYPVVDLALFKTRDRKRRRCAKVFWWVLGALLSLAFSKIFVSCETGIGENIGRPSITATTNAVQTLGQTIPYESNSKE